MAGKKASTTTRQQTRASARKTQRSQSAAAKRPTFVTPTWSTKRTDWKKRIVNRETLTPCPPLFPEEAAIGWDYYASLKMVDQGRVSNGDFPTYGELAEPWVREFVEGVFGSYCGVEGHPLEGRRLIKEFFMLISKKNGKSTLAAGIMLTALLLNWREEAEFIVLAPTKEIADNSFKPMAAAVREDEELSELLHVQSHIRTITHRETKATIKVVAAGTDTVSGKKAVIVLIDELHEFGKVKNADQIFTEATGGLMSRPEGFVMYLTTQSSEPPAGVFKDKLAYARAVRDGKIEDPQFYPIIYEFPQEMVESKDHLKPENYYVTNPNMGRSVDEDFLVREIAKAKATSEQKLLDVMAKHLNVEVGMNLASDSWAGAAHWMGCESIPRDLDYILSNCEVVVAGIDGGGLDDLYGVNVMGRHKLTKQWLSWEHAFAHPVVLNRRQEIAPRLHDFEREGDLTICNAVGEDSARVVELMVHLHKSGLLFGIGFDPNSLGGLLTDLVDAGIPEDKLLRCNTGWHLAASIKTAERYIAAGMVCHAHRPMMNWCVGNAKVEQTKNAIVITKQKSGTAKIDPLMAFLNSVEIMAGNPPAMRRELNFSRMELVG